jgi:dinuclear metal center YbgI/SA1388 family protein
MPLRGTEIIDFLQTVYPSFLVQKWDNCGLQVGNAKREIKKVLITLDVNDAVIEEAEALHAEMILSHHPLIFQPLKSLNCLEPIANTITKAIKKDILIYAMHTNLDVAKNGVSEVLAQLFELEDISILMPTFNEQLLKLAVFVPMGYEEKVHAAISNAGGGHIGNYSHCSFQTKGTGTFKPLQGTSPFIGSENVLTRVDEVKIETVVPKRKLKQVLQAMLEAHPYEEVAYDLYPIENQGEQYGFGRVGRLKENLNFDDFLKMVCSKLGSDWLRVAGNKNIIVRKLAVCGGSGGDFINEAANAGANVYLTGDIKYHQAQYAVERGLTVIDAGHYYTERPIILKLYELCSQAFNKDAVEFCVSKVNTNPFELQRQG